MLAEHQARDGEARLGLRAAEPHRAGRASARLRITSTPAKPSRFARRKSCASSALGSTSVITPGQPCHSGHRRAVEVGRAARGERQLEREQVVARRVVRLAVLGDRATCSSPIVPASPSGYQAPSSSNGVDLAVAVQLDEVRAEQDAAADRALGAVDPERRAAARGARVADRADERRSRRSPHRISTFAPHGLRASSGWPGDAIVRAPAPRPAWSPSSQQRLMSIQCTS